MEIWTTRQRNATFRCTLEKLDEDNTLYASVLFPYFIAYFVIFKRLH